LLQLPDGVGGWTKKTKARIQTGLSVWAVDPTMAEGDYEIPAGRGKVIEDCAGCKDADTIISRRILDPRGGSPLLAPCGNPFVVMKGRYKAFVLTKLPRKRFKEAFAKPWRARSESR